MLCGPACSAGSARGKNRDIRKETMYCSLAWDCGLLGVKISRTWGFSNQSTSASNPSAGHCVAYIGKSVKSVAKLLGSLRLNVLGHHLLDDL